MIFIFIFCTRVVTRQHTIPGDFSGKASDLHFALSVVSSLYYLSYTYVCKYNFKKLWYSAVFWCYIKPTVAFGTNKGTTNIEQQNLVTYVHIRNKEMKNNLPFFCRNIFFYWIYNKHKGHKRDISIISFFTTTLTYDFYYTQISKDFT